MNGNGNGSRRPEEIQAEIERTRNEMDGTLSAIEHRLTPGQIFDQGMSYLKNNGGTEFVQNLGDQAKTNPMPVALVGIGLAWLMATGKGPSLGSSSTSHSIGSAKQRIGETASAVRDRASQVADRAGQIRDTTRDQIDRAKSGIDSMMREQPLAIGAIGLAIGALAAAMAPRTRVEDRTLGRARDELAEKANEQVKQTTQEVGQQAGATPPDPTQAAREQERKRLQEGVRPYAERKSAEPPV